MKYLDCGREKLVLKLNFTTRRVFSELLADFSFCSIVEEIVTAKNSRRSRSEDVEYLEKNMVSREF